MPADDARDRLRAASAALDRVRHDWLRHPGVTAVDVGLQRSPRAGGAPALDSGGSAGAPVLRVHVGDRAVLDQVAAQLPDEVEGFPVCVIAASYGLEDAGGTTDGPRS